MNGIGGVFDFREAPVSSAEVEVRTHSGHVLAWNGRLDNREELLSHFSYGFEGVKSDAAFVMAAYLKWGDEFLSRIVGDFVLSLYDPRIFASGNSERI